MNATARRDAGGRTQRGDPPARLDAGADRPETVAEPLRELLEAHDDHHQGQNQALPGSRSGACTISMIAGPIRRKP